MANRNTPAKPFQKGNQLAKLAIGIPKTSQQTIPTTVIDYVLKFYEDKGLLDSYLSKLTEDDAKGWTIFKTFMELKIQSAKLELDREKHSPVDTGEQTITIIFPEDDIDE